METPIVSGNYLPTYTPIKDEIIGVTYLGWGLCSLGVSVIIKAGNMATGSKCRIPYITEDAAKLFAEVGYDAVCGGFPKVMPMLIVATGVYTLSKVLLPK